ncbi:MAG TPA: DUF6600 domain-containing protein [Terracidiphilus sp.]|nr:DUF6600 domain-containing protein [Terracidiphilus sp.]
MFALSSSKRFALAAVCAAAMAAAASACAQDDPPPEAGRISYISGNVSIQPVTSDDWGQAYPNLPVGPGDRIFTDSDGRAEIQVGQTYVRIGPNSDVTLVDDSTFNINFGIAQGSIHLHSFGLWPRQLLDISTPNGNAEFGNAGDIRVDVLPTEGATVFTNLGQFADITAAGDFRQELNYGQSLELAGSNPVSPQWLQPAGPDDLDSWSQQRDQQLARVASFQYVSPDIPGAADLDASGDWQPATEYGAVWFPRNVSADWEPYHNGHWINRDPWGWVWVEDESWGYAPFHYGRWVNYSGRWGWVPGPVNVRPIWSPALVVFAGGVHVGGGGGLSAWFPLGPGEAYRPWYRCSPRYIDQVNITNIRESQRVHVQNTYVNVNVTNITYVNQTRGMSAMRQDDFASGRSMRNVAVHVDPREMQQARPLARPEATPSPRAFVSRPVTRPVPVSIQRPELINQQGRQIAARPGATPVAAPVRPAPPMRQLPGRTIVAAPAHPVQNGPGGGRFPGVQNGQQQQPGSPTDGFQGRAPRANPVGPVQGIQRQPLNPQRNPNPPTNNNNNERQPGQQPVQPTGQPTAPPNYRQQDRSNQAPNNNDRQPGPQPVMPGVQPTGRPMQPPPNSQQDRPNQAPGNNDRQPGPQPVMPGVQPTGRPMQPPPNSQQDRPNYQQDRRPNQPQPQNPPPQQNRQDFGPVQPNKHTDQAPPPANNPPQGRPSPPPQEQRQVMPPERPVYQPQERPIPPSNPQAASPQQNKQQNDQKQNKDQKKDDKKNDKKDDKKHD